MVTLLVYFLLISFWAEKVLRFSLTGTKGISLFNIVIYALLFLWGAIVVIQNKKPFRSNNLNKYLILMTLVAMISIFLKYNYHEIPYFSLKDELIGLKNWLNPYIVFFILYNIIKDEKTCRNILIGLIVFLFVTAFSTPLISLGILKIGVYYDVGTGRASGLSEPNQYASYLVLFIPLVVMYFLFSKNFISKIVIGALLVVTFIALVITGSRGGAVSFVLSMCIYLLFLKREGILRFRGIVFAITMLSFIGLFSFLLSPSQIKETVLKRFNPKDQDTLIEITEGHGRRLLWQNAWQIFLEKPILGHGPDTFLPLNIIKFRVRGVTHNDYLRYMVEFGIVGLAIFIMILTRIFGHVWRHLKATSDSWRKILYASYLAGLFGYSFSMLGVNLYEPRFFFWIYTATIYKYTELDIMEES